jgi:uncharacterized protein YcbK (DUF882 family)
LELTHKVNSDYNGNPKKDSSLHRREFLKFGYRFATLAAATCVAPRPVLAATRRSSPPKDLSFYNLHTGESLRVTYAANGRYIPDALQEVDYILRDFRTGEVKAIDPDLLDLLHSISKTMGLTAQHSLHVVSGYRSPQTNAMLREISHGIAKNSYHIKGQALDFRVPPFPLAYLRKAALSLRAGGVGFYPRSNFVHVDVGKFRYW